MRPEAENLGYDDMPILPGTNYHVHDGARPQPRVVTPGTPSSQEQPGVAPSDAVILPGVAPECAHHVQCVQDVLAICDRYPDRFIPFCNSDPGQFGASPAADL